MTSPDPPQEPAPEFTLDDALRHRIGVDGAASAETGSDGASGQGATQTVHSLRPVFTGDGAEYFRIWVVNLLLTLATLGLYSAWAKVRKTRYFWQNTRLDGHVFDFHGNPLAILRGRLLALVLVAAYTWSFEFSAVAGVLTILLLCLLGPWLFMSAQRFRLRNTSHRGLRFDFAAGTSRSYVVLLPLLLIWFSGTLGGVLLAEQGELILVLGLATVVLFPWMHHRLKAFQHSNAGYGNLRSAFVPAPGRFYGVYLRALVVLAWIAVLYACLVWGSVTGAELLVPWLGESPSVLLLSLVGMAAALLALAGYLATWAYFALRLQQVVWRNTTFGELRFDTHIEARRYAGLVLRCVLLTLLTLGLYWPFAAVRLARYRVQCMEVRHLHSPEQLSAGIRRAPASAAGEGAVDLFGLDVGL